MAPLTGAAAGARRAIGAFLERSPVRARRIGPRPLAGRAVAMPGTRIVTEPVGFLGATEEDQRRWLTGFRQLLDGLEAPLQTVMAFRSGASDVGSAGAPPANLSGRAGDLAFAEQLARHPGAQSRSVTLVTGAHAAAGLVDALRQMGIAARVVDEGGGEPPRGDDTAHAHHDPRGHHRSWYLHRFPGTELEPGWLLRLAPPGQEVTIAWHAEPLPSAWMIAYLQRQLAQMRARHLDQETPSHTDPILAGALPQAADLQRRIAASEERAFHLSLYVTLTAPTREELDEGSGHLESAARATLAQLHPCTFRMADARLATLPLGLDLLRRHRVIDTSSLVTFFPWLDADLAEEAGMVIGASRATRRPVLLDPFDDGKRANANVGVFGHSGAGKTYLLSSLAMGMLGRGGQVFIIDPEREYGDLAARLGGAEVNLTLGSGQALNVLQRPPPESRRDPGQAPPAERWLGPAVADALDLIAVICGDLDEPERAVTEAAIRRTYEEQEEPVLADVAGRLPEASRPARVLARWVHGSLGAMFSAPTNVNLDVPIVAFAMRELREELVAPVHFLLAEALWTRIKTRRRRRLLIVDELGLLFDDPTI
ncbi:MAG: VirB4 family type IV secretion system protein, partial [Candidatus Dormibacteraceae bacterium]